MITKWAQRLHINYISTASCQLVDKAQLLDKVQDLQKIRCLVKCKKTPNKKKNHKNNPAQKKTKKLYS